VFRSVDELSFEIDGGGTRIIETRDGRDLADFALVQVAAYPRPTAALIGAIGAYLEDRKVPAVNIAGIGVPTKLVQYVRFAQAGLPVPPTVYRSGPALAESFVDLAARLELPLVLKALSASNGRYNFLVSDEYQLRSHLEDPQHAGISLLAQRFVANDTTYRLLVLGDTVALAIRRQRAGDSHLSNTSQGGTGSLVDPADLDPYVRRLALDAAREMGNEVTAVNLIQDWTDGRWYVLGADANPALTSGAFAGEKMHAYWAYLCRRLSRSARTGTARGGAA
jgi:glutathione synthase/RimK-type ligase-like ATP-grasp enzyme